MQYNIKYLAGMPVDYYFVRGLCNHNVSDTLCIQKLYKNRITIYPPTYSKVKTEDPRVPIAIVNLQHNSCSMIESFIYYCYLMSQHIRMTGYMPTDTHEHIQLFTQKQLDNDQITRLILHFLSSRMLNCKLHTHVNPSYIMLECTSCEPLFHLLQHMSSMFPNICIYYNHNGMKSTKTVRIENTTIKHL
jgi:hypothetical protein